MLPDFLPPHVDAAIWSRFPDYRALSIVARDVAADGGGPSLAIAPAAWIHEHAASWRQAFQAFGSNPKRTPPSMEALLRRFLKDGGLPRIHPVVDCYNALSLRFGAPFGGEDLDRYVGPPRLVVADGTERFGTVRDGEPFEETAEPGEIIWRDDVGVTCRRWNWRQCRRTAITAESRNLWFVIDRLPPMSMADLEAAGEALVAGLRRMSPASSFATTLLQPGILD